MEFVVFLLIGMVAGWLASVLVRGRGLGVIGDIVVGVVGAFVGGFVFRVVGLESFGLLGAVIRATVGAVVLLAIIKVLRRV